MKNDEYTYCTVRRWSPPTSLFSEINSRGGDLIQSIFFLRSDSVGMNHGKKLYNSRKLDLDVARKELSPKTRSEIRLVSVKTLTAL